MQEIITGQVLLYCVNETHTSKFPCLIREILHPAGAGLGQGIFISKMEDAALKEPNMNNPRCNRG